ncbi:MAG: PEP-CTERM sorting domain-containing protein [Pirellulales bacterium]|nr:PEP-CTERM sorting domain-containing protein [Pirellulales bacterium]
MTYAASSSGGTSFFDVFVDDPGSNPASYAVTNFKFSGVLLNNKAFFALDVNKEADADVFAVTVGSGYVKNTDTWVGKAWTDFPGTGIISTPSLFQVTAGTGGGSQFTKVLLAHIVATGNVGYEGTISRLGQDYAVSGTLAVPEPGTIALGTLGALAMVPLFVRRGRRNHPLVARG